MIELIIGVACLSILFITAEPVTIVKRYLKFKEEEYFEMSKTRQFFHRLIYCPSCVGFWFGLFTSQDILVASIISITSDLLYKIMIKL
jgi:hypothetical protein